jgi:uncharacterized membrane protein
MPQALAEARAGERELTATRQTKISGACYAYAGWISLAGTSQTYLERFISIGTANL